MVVLVSRPSCRRLSSTISCSSAACSAAARPRRCSCCLFFSPCCCPMRRGDMSSEGAPSMREPSFAPGRVLIYLVVSLMALAYLAPLFIVVLNSLRTNEEIAQSSMIGWPQQWAWSNYLTAWSGFCVAQTCAGIRPYMLNSALITIPATIFSTMLGAVAGYAVSLWRFPGDRWIYGIVTLCIFLPQQMRLLPWTIVLRDIGLINTLTGL